MQKIPKNQNLINLFLKMSSDREQNGPTQVHSSLNFNEMNTHIQLNGINGSVNGIMGKSYGKSIYLFIQFEKFSSQIVLL